MKFKVGEKVRIVSKSIGVDLQRYEDRHGRVGFVDSVGVMSKRYGIRGDGECGSGWWDFLEKDLEPWIEIKKMDDDLFKI